MTDRHTTRVYGNSRKPRRAKHERSCSEPGCSTRLTAYNPNDKCYQHARRKRPRIR